MRKTLTTARIALIALFPIAFLLTIGNIHADLHLRVIRTFNPRYGFWLIPIYVFCGFIVAISTFGDKSFFKRKAVLAAHIFSFLAVAAFCTAWILLFNGVLSLNATTHNILVTVDVGSFSLILGYTLAALVRATILFFRRADR